MAEFLQSKKALALIGAIILILVTRIAGKLGIVLDADTAKQVSDAITGICAAYLIGQGISDHGKGAAEVHVEAAAAAQVTPPAPVAPAAPVPLPVTH